MERLIDPPPTPPVGGGEPEPRWSTTNLIGLFVAVVCSLFVFVQMRPDLLFADTTPAGGDMGAHVWGPAYLRDHLLGQGRLSGWTPDWYAGFPAYQFYMVIPSLAIVIINGGLGLALSAPLALIIIGGSVALSWGRNHARWYRVAAVVVALALVAVPYGVAFKLVSVVGLVTFPGAAWALGRLARAPEPVPPLLSVASLFFLFDTNFTIYGGNVASTLAGEFAFSISLTLTLLAIGMALRGMEDHTWRARSAVVVALVALTHVIPVFYMMVALVAALVVGRQVSRTWAVATGVAMALLPVAFADGTSTSAAALAVGAAVVTFAAAMLAEPEIKRRVMWLLVAGPVAVLLSAFWLLPFYLREPFFNDMGWERLNEVGPALLTVPMKVALPIAAVGAVSALAMRERLGMVLTTLSVVFLAAVANVGEGPLWNARLLPFYYLSVYLLAAVGAAMVIRFAAMALSEDFSRPDARTVGSAGLVALVAGLIAVGIPLRILPFGEASDDGTYRWLAFTSHEGSFLPSWTAWNYSGYERKPSYREYHNVVMAMDEVGEVNGCGRAMWEYDKSLDRYGTPMALMLLPHWTDGCIGSMEGLYFESSATTPFHFLNQSVLSQAPSRAQRDLPYQSFDLNRGIQQLQIMGVRYYMAQTDDSIAAAMEHPDLTEVADAQPFVVFEVGGSELVEGLQFEPLVVSGQTEEEAGEIANRFDIGWISQAVTAYNDPANYPILPAEDGPAEWQRESSLTPLEGELVDEAAIVDNVVATDSRISFTVDQVGSPVLVKTSFFPNWTVDGADGPWRAGPNLMVVVPTETSVELSYGRTVVDWLGIIATLLGLVGLAGLFTLDRRFLVRQGATEVWGETDRGWGDDLAILTGEFPKVTVPEPEPARVEADGTAGGGPGGILPDVSTVPAGDSSGHGAVAGNGAESPDRTVAEEPGAEELAAEEQSPGGATEQTLAEEEAVEVATTLSIEVTREKPASS